MAGKTPEETLEEARTHIGDETEPVQSRYPVEYDPIRRYCHMLDDDNPLFLDPDYARTTDYGTVIAPPFFIRQTSGPGPWPPAEQSASVLANVPTAGERTINLNVEFEVLKPVKVGDRISVSQRLADVYIKPIRIDPKAFWLVYDTIYRNQAGEVVLVMRNTLVKHRSPDEVAAAAS